MKIIALDKRRIAARRFDDDLAIIDLRGRTVHRLNATGSELWDIIARGGAYDDLVRNLCERYEVNADAAQRDVDAFLASLEGAGLVKVEDVSSNDVVSRVAGGGL
jgi:hypothetical protein